MPVFSPVDQWGTVDDAAVLGNTVIEQAVGFGAKAAWNATVGPAVNAAIDSAVSSIFGTAVMEGGGVAAGSGLAAGSGVAAGSMVGGALAAFAPAGVFLAIATFLSAIGKATNYARPIDHATLRWDGAKFVVQRDLTVNDDDAGRRMDQVANRLNDYYAARPFDAAAYYANDEYRAVYDPENPSNGSITEDPNRIASFGRVIPDIRTPTVGYEMDVGWTGDSLALANGDGTVNSTIRRVLLRAGESAESIDAFIGGPDKGRAGGVARVQSFQADYRGGAEEPVLDNQAAINMAPDYALRYQLDQFVPLDQYQSVQAEETPAPTAAPPVPEAPAWLDVWAHKRSAPTERPKAIDESLWNTWENASAKDQAGAWRYIGVDPWRELTGLTV